MPTYSFTCPRCNYSLTGIFPMRLSQGPIPCEGEGCDAIMDRVIEMPAAVFTEDNFVEGGLGTHFNIHTETEQTRSEYKKWKRDVERAAKEDGREVHIGEKVAGKRKERGQRIADDISKHGTKAREHYVSESQRKSLAEKA